MKVKYLINVCAVASLLAAFSTIGSGQVIAQYDFTVIGLPDSDPLCDLTAAGSITFDMDGSVDVFIENTGCTTSQITAFYMLRPTDLAGEMMTNAAVTFEGSTPDEWDDWEVKTELSSFLKEFNYPGDDFDVDVTDYFGVGVASGSSERIDYIDGNPPVIEGGLFAFSFDFGDAYTSPFNTDAWFNNIGPHVYVRWQGVGLDGQDSGKGYDNVVPEPRLIGPLALIALGGLLWLRRRLPKTG